MSETADKKPVQKTGMISVPRVMIAGTASGCGKTTVVCAVLAALRKRGAALAAFKCGPDFIDPMFHSRVLGVPSRNLDPYFMDRETLQYLLVKNSVRAWQSGQTAAGSENAPPSGHRADPAEYRQSGMAVMEGVMGYYDGLAMQDEASSHDLALKTKTPVILVADGRGRSRSAQAELKGFAEFADPSLIKGVIFNQAAPSVVPALNEYAASIGIRPLGYLPKVPGAEFKSRHLGLITAQEIGDLQQKVSLLADAAEQTLDLDGIRELAFLAPQLPSAVPVRLALALSSAQALPSSEPSGTGLKTDGATSGTLLGTSAAGSEAELLRIGIAKDLAFCFYYEDNLDLLKEMGCELVPFSPLSDEKLPENLSGLYLGGGYPELYGKELSSNHSMLESIRSAIDGGLPALAECGGFMYLHSSLQSPDGSRWPMADVIRGKVSFTTKLQHFGYVEMQAQQDTILCSAGERIRAHEFHRSLSDAAQDAFLERKGNRTWTGFTAQGSLLAGWPHLHFMAEPSFALHFVQTCRRYRQRTAF